jgi:phenylacetate-CoA ligase
MNEQYQQGQEQALELFHRAYRDCPAYTDFIDRAGVTASTIKSADDFARLPLTDKKNYIKKYPLEKRIYKDKKLSDFYMLCSSSGSSGEPTYWPRDYQQDLRLEQAKLQMLEAFFQISQQRTLIIVSFGLGVWTAGMLTTRLCWPLAKDHQVSVVTTGMDKANIYSFINSFYGDYDQIIIMGYPPFLTDAIEYIQQQKFDLHQANIKLLYTSEQVSQKWRRRMASLLAKKPSLNTVMGFYACSDTGIVGLENQVLIELLRLADQNPALASDLFGQPTSPTLVGFDPRRKFVESVAGEIVITADQPVPLVRYNIHDRGRVFSDDHLTSTLNRYHLTLSQPILAGMYLSVSGRSDAVKVTANIYIEDIKYCLEKSPLAAKLSGSFRYGREQLTDLRYRLKVRVFLKPGEQLSASEQKQFEQAFYIDLLEANNDFKMIQSGIKVEEFAFEYLPDDPTKYQSSKLNYFL